MKLRLPSSMRKAAERAGLTRRGLLTGRGLLKASAAGAVGVTAWLGKEAAADKVLDVITDEPTDTVVVTGLGQNLLELMPSTSHVRKAIEIYREMGSMERPEIFVAIEAAGIAPHSTEIVEDGDRRLRIRRKGTDISLWKTRPGQLVSDKPSHQFGVAMDREIRRSMESRSLQFQHVHAMFGSDVLRFTRCSLPLFHRPSERPTCCLTVRDLERT